MLRIKPCEGSAKFFHNLRKSQRDRDCVKTIFSALTSPKSLRFRGCVSQNLTFDTNSTPLVVACTDYVLSTTLRDVFSLRLVERCPYIENIFSTKKLHNNTIRDP